MKGRKFLVTSVALIWGACLLHGNDLSADRAAFARAISAVSKGMPAEDVVELLGKPDDVRTEFDPGWIRAAQTTEIWCYGTSGHLTCPTLGCVFMAAGAAQYVFGGSGTPPEPAMITEADLKKLLQEIDHLSESKGRDPLLYIQLVNTLHPLGKLLVVLGPQPKCHSCMATTVPRPCHNSTASHGSALANKIGIMTHDYGRTSHQ